MATQAAKRDWNAAARGWEHGYEWYAHNVRPLTEWFCDMIAFPGARVLDVACGTGQPALAIAARAGSVVAADLAPEMLAAASRRARSEGIENIAFMEMDAEDLRFDDCIFDAVSCACGLMFCSDPVKAVSEMRRVLVPRGRLAIAVWDEPAQSPFFTLAGKVLSSVLAAPPSPGARPLAPAENLAAVLREGGWSEFSIARRPLTFEIGSVDEYWSLLTSFAPGLEQKLAKLPERDLHRALEALHAAAADFVVDGRLRLRATPLCATGRTPS